MNKELEQKLRNSWQTYWDTTPHFFPNTIPDWWIAEITKLLELQKFDKDFAIHDATSKLQ